MKHLLAAILLFSIGFVNAQDLEDDPVETEEPQVQISVNGKSLKASVLRDNQSNNINLFKKQEGKMVILDFQAKSDTSNYRKFMLVDANDEVLKIPFTARLVGIINVNLADIFKQTEAGKTYYLYTISTPKDPQLAARVRVKRVLLSKIEIK